MDKCGVNDGTSHKLVHSGGPALAQNIVFHRQCADYFTSVTNTIIMGWRIWPCKRQSMMGQLDINIGTMVAQYWPIIYNAILCIDNTLTHCWFNVGPLSRLMCLGYVQTILFWPSLAYMCTKMSWNPIHFISFYYFEMILPSRHSIRNSGLRSSTLPLGHRGSPQYIIITIERGKNILFLLSLKARVGLEPATFQAGSFNHFTRGP